MLAINRAEQRYRGEERINRKRVIVKDPVTEQCQYNVNPPQTWDCLHSRQFETRLVDPGLEGCSFQTMRGPGRGGAGGTRGPCAGGERGHFPQLH
ncbi:hypothetical protein NDU88_001558 [Pleurodeles waltl]|uniref:Uncharacterized protein n=1 Tax=Pleurodeles waltl TaxID=8319 RepID=A0AAV7VWV3_PLEWA|nr:hypothetical protein NDU88_001558 [Pleurodeles waltl]